MSRRALLVFVVACGGSAHTAHGPTLEPDKPMSPPAAPVSFDTEFAAPQSRPSGEPVEIAVFTPAVGLRRTRTIDKLFSVDEDLGEGKSFEQRTTTRFVLREEILAARDTTIEKLQVTAETAEERVELRGRPHQMQLLDGTYVVAAGGKRGLTVTRQAGTDVGGREVEELSQIYGDQVGMPFALGVVLATRTLRLGEAVKLTPDELARLGAETDITLSLIALDGGIATFQFLSVTSGPYVFGEQGEHENIGTKAAVGIEIATGRVIRADLLDLRVVEGKSIKRSQRTMKLEYPR